MALTHKTEDEKARQKLFEMLRHYFSSKHQVPCYLTKDKLQELVDFLGEHE